MFFLPADETRVQSAPEWPDPIIIHAKLMTSTLLICIDIFANIEIYIGVLKCAAGGTGQLGPNEISSHFNDMLMFLDELE